jgi:hypothetical protein
MSRASTDLTLPSEQDALLAQRASLALEQQGAGTADMRLQLTTPGSKATAFDLPAPAVRLLMELLKELGAGHAVTIVPVEAEITTQ